MFYGAKLICKVGVFPLELFNLFELRDLSVAIPNLLFGYGSFLYFTVDILESSSI